MQNAALGSINTYRKMSSIVEAFKRCFNSAAGVVKRRFETTAFTIFDITKTGV